VNTDSFLKLAYEIGSFWWTPVFFWIAYFLWSYFWDYPADLEKHIRTGKVWPYLPIFWKAEKKKLIRIVSIFLFWVGNLSCACSLLYLFPRFKQEHFSITFFAIGIAFSTLTELKIRSFAIKDIIHLQRDRYFQIYTQLASQAVSRGDEVSDGELFAKAQWQHQNDLRLADKQGRLVAFLKGEAKL
jgi:hypothetical protein